MVNAFVTSYVGNAEANAVVGATPKVLKSRNLPLHVRFRIQRVHEHPEKRPLPLRNET